MIGNGFSEVVKWQRVTGSMPSVAAAILESSPSQQTCMTPKYVHRHVCWLCVLIIIIQKICSAHISTLLGAQGVNPESPGQAPFSFTNKCRRFFYVHYTTHGTYSFTSHPKDEAIMVKCLAQGHKRRDRSGVQYILVVNQLGCIGSRHVLGIRFRGYLIIEVQGSCSPVWVHKAPYLKSDVTFQKPNSSLCLNTYWSSMFIRRFHVLCFIW